MRYYITPDDYKSAEKIGVSNNLLYLRVYRYGWSVDKAISVTPGKRICRKKYLKIARENGIKDVTFYSRINRGWAMDKASTVKPICKEGLKDEGIRIV